MRRYKMYLACVSVPYICIWCSGVISCRRYVGYAEQSDRRSHGINHPTAQTNQRQFFQGPTHIVAFFRGTDKKWGVALEIIY